MKRKHECKLPAHTQVRVGVARPSGAGKALAKRRNEELRKVRDLVWFARAEAQLATLRQMAATPAGADPMGDLPI